MTKKSRPQATGARKLRGRSGKDEMNLAVFPIAALSVRVPKDVKALKFQDSIQGDGGKIVKRDVAVTKCKKTSGADVVVTGDARQGDWDELRAALEAAGVAVYVKQKR